jgi:hypothetical protein
MAFIIRFWSTLISLIFVSCATVITSILALASTTILFVCALIVTPFFSFHSAASVLVEKVTEIVVAPLSIAGSTITTMWKQLWGIATGRVSDTESDATIDLIAATAIRLALSAICLAAISLAPVPGAWLPVAYILSIGILIAIWTIFIVQSMDEPKDDAVRVGAIVILLSISASVLSALAEVSITGQWRVWSFVLAGVVLLLVWLAVIANAWGLDDQPPAGSARSSSAPLSGGGWPGQPPPARR